MLTNDEAGDARLVAELRRAEYDGVAIGGYIDLKEVAKQNINNTISLDPTPKTFPPESSP